MLFELSIVVTDAHPARTRIKDMKINVKLDLVTL